MAQPVYTQNDCAFYNDGTEAGSTLISGSNIIVGNTGAEDKGFDTTILIRAAISLTEKAESNSFAILVSKNGAAYDTLGNVSGITAVDSSNLTNGDDCTNRLSGSGSFQSNNNGVGDNTTTPSTAYTLNNYWNVLFSFEIDEVDVVDGDYFDFRVYQDAGSTALDTYSETLRVTVDKAAPVEINLSTATLTSAGQILSPEVDLSVSLSQATLTISGQTLTVDDGGGQTIYIDHEEGDYTDYTSQTNVTDLAVNGAAAMVGSYGLQVYLDGNNNATYATRDFTIGTSDIRFRYYFDINGLSMGSGDAHGSLQISLDGSSGGVTLLAYLYVGYNGSNYTIIARGKDDANGTHNSSTETLSNDVHYIEVHIHRATNSGSSDGYVNSWLDGVAFSSQVTGLDNYDIFPTIDGIDVGATSQLDATTTGYMYFDDIFINDNGAAIGPAATDVSINLSTATLTAAGQTLSPEVDLSVSLGTATLTASGQSANPNTALSISLNQATLTIAGQIATPKVLVTVPFNAAALTIAGQTLSPEIGLSVSLGTAALTSSGQTLTVARDLSVLLSAAALSISGQTAQIERDLSVSLALANIVLSGQTASVEAPLTVALSNAAITSAGQALNVAVGLSVSLSTAAISATGQALSPEVGLSVALSNAAITAAGQTLSTAIGLSVSLAKANIASQGQTITVLSTDSVPLAKAAMSIAGQTITIATDVTINLAKASLAIAGQILNPTSATTVSLGTANITASGQTLSVRTATSVALDTANITASGQTLSVVTTADIEVMLGTANITASALQARIVTAVILVLAPATLMMNTPRASVFTAAQAQRAMTGVGVSPRIKREFMRLVIPEVKAEDELEEILQILNIVDSTDE